MTPNTIYNKIIIFTPVGHKCDDIEDYRCFSAPSLPFGEDKGHHHHKRETPDKEQVVKQGG